MTLVGPRPLTDADLCLMRCEDSSAYKRRSRINSKPGITGYWQVYGNREKGAEDLMDKDEYYEKNKSFALDMKIMIKTLIIMITASHSDSIVGEKINHSDKFEIRLKSA